MIASLSHPSLSVECLCYFLKFWSCFHELHSIVIHEMCCAVKNGFRITKKSCTRQDMIIKSEQTSWDVKQKSGFVFYVSTDFFSLKTLVCPRRRVRFWLQHHQQNLKAHLSFDLQLFSVLVKFCTMSNEIAAISIKNATARRAHRHSLPNMCTAPRPQRIRYKKKQML